MYDYKQEVLGDHYRESDPLRNWLLYKLSGRDCDRIALADELVSVQATGHQASPDSMHSFWTTYKRAIQIWYGETFTLRGVTNNVRRLLALHDAGQFAEVNTLFATFARLSHVRGNFILMPVYSDPRTGKPSPATNLNLVRNRKKLDYWDLTLAGIKSCEFRAFFGGNRVATQFDISAMPGGFSEYAAQNSLGAYLDSAGDVLPLWPNHLAPGAKRLPQTKSDVRAFLDNACAVIERRTLDLAG